MNHSEIVSPSLDHDMAHAYLRLQFQVKPLAGSEAPLVGPVVRRVLGRALVAAHCPAGEPVCQAKRGDAGKPSDPGALCSLAGSCPYGVLFAASRSARPPFSLFVHPPPRAGAARFLEVTLFGPAWRSYPWVARAVEEALLRGVGRGRWKWEVQAVFRTRDDRHRQRLSGGGIAALPLDLRPDRLPVPGLAAVSSAASPALSSGQVRVPQRVGIDLLSPTRLISGKRLLADGEPIPFSLLLARTLDRYFGVTQPRGGCGAARGGLGELESAARAVPLIDDGTVRRHQRDYSTRSRREIRLDGRVGRLIYGPEAVPFLPILRLAEILHLGKNPASGCGRVRVFTR